MESANPKAEQSGLGAFRARGIHRLAIVHYGANLTGGGGFTRMSRLPFGDPDGSRANFDDVINDFVHLDRRRFPSGISTSEVDRAIRVVVGKKGSGKTVYLRRLQDSTRHEDAVFASKIYEDVPNTNSVVAFCHLFDKEKVTEAWQCAWRIALLRSAISHVTCKTFFEADEAVDILQNASKEYPKFLKSYNVERSAYSEIKEIISSFQTAAQFWKFVQDPVWDDIQLIFGTALKSSPPLFLYLDAVDDEFAHAPMEWHRCQKGLFYAVMRFLRRSGAIGSRLHVVIAMRDIVYSSVVESEHRTRYINIPQICLLDWDYRAIEHFLIKKIEQLNVPFLKNRKSKPISNFVGLDTIWNQTRQCEEQIAPYLIRHTRCLPRDIVQLGNALVAERLKWENGRRPMNHGADSSESNGLTWSQRVKSVVAYNAAIFAEEQLQICANQLSSHDAPARSAQQNYAEIYTSNQDYIRSKRDILALFIRKIGKERFTREDALGAQDALANELPQFVSIPTILWQNGLIGARTMRSGDFYEFYNLTENAGFSIPDCEEYAFHSILLDVIPDLIMPGKLPVSEHRNY